MALSFRLILGPQLVVDRRLLLVLDPQGPQSAILISTREALGRSR
jgi:hypothetical protein